MITELESVLDGKFKLVRRIGGGGYGEVYLGEHAQLQRKVAIKFLLHGFATQPDLVTRFHREARSAAALIHPNIIDIYDVGERNDIHFFVMKYIEGETLAQKMSREKRIPPANAIQIIKQLADALDYAHSNNVIHRDVKPSNVMIDSYGKPLLMDFGVARIQFEGKLTGKGKLLGTPHYLCPEQPLGSPVDGRSDIYSLGILFYEMLAGTPPFHDESSIALIFKHVHEAPPLLQEQVPDLNPKVCEVVHRMIEKLPEKRQQTGAQVVDDLEALSEIYPNNISANRRSTPMYIYNTDKLLLLARENVEKDKVSSAFQVLSTLVKREPDHESTHTEILEMVRDLVGRVRDRMSQNDFESAREICSQLSHVSSNEKEVQTLMRDVEVGEQTFRRNQFELHFEAARMALERNDAASAVSHLTRCANLDSAHQEVQRLLRETRERITSEIDLLCERLDFDTAEYVLHMGKGSFPELAGSKSQSLKEHRVLYRKLQIARELYSQERWKEAVPAFEEFLSSRPLYAFTVFQNLRSEAESSLRIARERQAREDVPSVPIRVKPYSTGRIVWILVIGFFCGAAIISLSVLLRRQAEIPDTHMDLSFLRKLKTVPRQVVPPKETVSHSKRENPTEAAIEKLATPQEVSPQIHRTLSIDSIPQGATIMINRKMYGVTPAKIENLRPGMHDLILRKRGYEDYGKSVEVQRTGVSTVHAELTAIRNTPPAQVSSEESEPVIYPGMIVTPGPDVMRPKVIKKTIVKYPDEAKKQRLSGTVKLDLLVSETGSVISVKVLQSAGRILDDAANKLVREWKYLPARKQGVPVSMWIQTTIHYVSPE